MSQSPDSTPVQEIGVTQEYMATDEDLVLAIARDPDFWQSASVRQALLTLVENPTLYLEGQQT